MTTSQLLRMFLTLMGRRLLISGLASFGLGNLLFVVADGVAEKTVHYFPVVLPTLLATWAVAIAGHWALFILGMRRLTAYFRPMTRGDFRGSIRICEEMLTNYAGVPQMEANLGYVVANCHTWLGEYDQSVKRIDAITFDHLAPHFRASFHITKAVNQLGMGQNLTDIATVLTEGRRHLVEDQVVECCEYQFLEAHVAAANGDMGRARQDFGLALTSEGGARSFRYTGWQRLIIGAPSADTLLAPVIDFCKFSFYTRDGQMQAASEALARLRAGTFPNCYKEMAESLRR